MKFFALTILILSLLALPADAARKRRPHRAGKRRAPVVRTCPPPVVRIVPDRVEFISRSEEENLHAAIAAWMKDQPEMSEAAQNKAREIAEKWYRLGRESAGRQ